MTGWFNILYMQYLYMPLLFDLLTIYALVPLIVLQAFFFFKKTVMGNLKQPFVLI